MFMVDEPAAEAIRRAYEDGGELSGIVEFKRRFPGGSAHRSRGGPGQRTGCRWARRARSTGGPRSCARSTPCDLFRGAEHDPGLRHWQGEISGQVSKDDGIARPVRASLVLQGITPSETGCDGMVTGSFAITSVTTGRLRETPSGGRKSQ